MKEKKTFEKLDLDWSEVISDEDDTFPGVRSKSGMVPVPAAADVMAEAASDELPEDVTGDLADIADEVLDATEDALIDAGIEEAAERFDDAADGLAEEYDELVEEYDDVPEEDAGDGEPVRTGLHEEEVVGRQERELDTTKATYFNSLSPEEQEIYVKIQRRKREARIRKQRQRRTVAFIVIAALLAGIFFGGRALYRVIKEKLAQRAAEKAAYAEMIAGGNAETDGDAELVRIAVRELGKNGDKYINSWGYDTEVKWDAIFVSWVGNHASEEISKQVPMFQAVEDGSDYYKDRDLWIDGGRMPLAGYIIFFDFKDEETGQRDGVPDRVGIVSGSYKKRVFTIEGDVPPEQQTEAQKQAGIEANKTEKTEEDDFDIGEARRLVCRCGYDVDDPDILGYGVVGEFPVYDEDL